METTLLAVQAVATGLMAAWLTLGVRDNILYPDANEAITAEVMEMSRMRNDYPEVFAPVAKRAITNRRVQLLAFRCVVLAEAITALILWAGVALLITAVTGYGSADTARIVAIVGAMSFTSVWASFLIVGNHFCYWFCHEGAQNTHFQMTLWGLGTTILIAVAS